MTVVGVLGGGQLGRMLALAGYPMGLRFRFLDPAADAPAGLVGEHLCAAYDESSLSRFSQGLDVVTYEFENVPLAAAAFVAARLPVYPPPLALEVTQDRLREKEFLLQLGLPTAAFAAVDSLESLAAGLKVIGTPAVLKARQFGYDGGGQARLRAAADAARAWSSLGGRPAILERQVPFLRELSLIAVRARTGETRFYPLVENRHTEGILRCSLAPGPGVARSLQTEAEGYASKILGALDYVGVLTLELFECDGGLCINELAPRVHNSGHWTIEGAETSQFENHLRAILGLPLGSTSPVRCSVLVNIIGTLPDTDSLLRVPDTHLHLYGKAPRPGRKLGHVTARVADAGLIEDRLRLLQRLQRRTDGTEADSCAAVPQDRTREEMK